MKHPKYLIWDMTEDTITEVSSPKEKEKDNKSEMPSEYWI